MIFVPCVQISKIGIIPPAGVYYGMKTEIDIRETSSRLRSFGVSSCDIEPFICRIDKWNVAFLRAPHGFSPVPAPKTEHEARADALITTTLTLLISEFCTCSHEQIMRVEPAGLNIVQKYKISPKLTARVLLNFRDFAGAGAGGLSAEHSTYASTGVIKEPYWLLFYNLAGDGLAATQTVHPSSLVGKAVTGYRAAVKAKEAASQGKKIGVRLLVPARGRRPEPKLFRAFDFLGKQDHAHTRSPNRHARASAVNYLSIEFRQPEKNSESSALATRDD